jgi:hypothetical protein
MSHPTPPSIQTRPEMAYPSPTDYEDITHLQGEVIHKDGLRVGNVAVEPDLKGNLRLSRRFHTEEQRNLLKAMKDSSDEATTILVPVPRPPDQLARPSSSADRQRSRVVKFDMEPVSSNRPSSPRDMLGTPSSPRPQSGSFVEHDTSIGPRIQDVDRRTGSAPSSKSHIVGQRARGSVVVSSNRGRRNQSADSTTRHCSRAVDKLVIIPINSTQSSKSGSRKGKGTKDCADGPNQVSNYPNLSEWMKLEPPCISPTFDTDTQTFGIEGVRARTSEKKERVTGSVLYF